VSSPELDALIAAIRENLTDDLLTVEQREMTRPTNSAGHCYVASETLWHMTGCAMLSYQLKHEGNSHWFLMDTLGEVFDITADQFETTPPYGDARRTSFYPADRPSNRAAILIRRLRAKGVRDAEAAAHPTLF
jgi:hypothetical protein